MRSKALIMRNQERLFLSIKSDSMLLANDGEVFVRRVLVVNREGYLKCGGDNENSMAGDRKMWSGFIVWKFWAILYIG